MDDLVAFLSARLDEDEAAAKAAARDVTRLAGRAHWSADLGMVTDAEDPDWAIADLGPLIEDNALHEHIAGHDPGRTLRDVAADRAILAEHANAHRAYQQARDDHARNLSLDRAETQLASAVALDKLIVWERVLRIRAAVYSDHRDYRQEWKP